MKGKKKSFEEVLSLLKERGNDEYGYEFVKKDTYVRLDKKIKIRCLVCGHVFDQTVSSHLNGVGCPYCYQRHKKLVYGVGINDVWDVVVEGKRIKSYETWKNILARCYGRRIGTRWASYEGCIICDEWLRFSSFKEWFDKNYIKDYALDKDILIKGNKVYSPETCCFVPQRINSLLVNRKRDRGGLPVGVSRKIVTTGVRFVATFGHCNKRIFCGSFDTVEEAFSAYKNGKEKYIKEVAQKYYDEGKITKHVYDALMRYEIEITD